MEGSCKYAENIEQPTWDGPPAGRSGGGLTTPHGKKKVNVHEILHRTSDLAALSLQLKERKMANTGSSSGHP